eukprot:GFUD01108582.1.p1 GENE.GFUD01108582.1~~GFUD01108582.1.p1  ORF type:complete len:188 (-),score=65.66 GFUD01108582.1:317-880(-)
MVKPRNKFQSRNLISFITIYYLTVPVQPASLFSTSITLLSTMCPFLSSCSIPSLWSLTQEDIPQSPFHASELGCSASRCWAEINDKFGEPQGSVRRVKRFGLGAERELMACNLSKFYRAGEEESIEDDREENTSTMQENPGAVLDISMKKQQEGKNDRLYKKVLVDNTIKIVQVELNRKIMESFLFF